MTRIAIDRRLGTYRIVLLLLMAIGVVAPTHKAKSAEASKTGPKIESARIGFHNHYKLGFWTPVWVEVSGVESADGYRVDVTSADSDGVATTASTPLQSPTTPGGKFSAVIYTQVGRIGGPIVVTLVDGDQQIAALTLQPNRKADDGANVVPAPATSEFIVSLGVTSSGLKDAFPDRPFSAGQSGRTLIELQSVADLPTAWFGYEAVDVLSIAVGDGKLCQELARDKVRFAALEQWVKLGGRLVILCGGEHAQAILGANGPLAPLVPGKLVEVVRLPETSSLEHYAASAAPISAVGGVGIQVPRLTEVDGNIELFYSGGKPTDLPLVVRAARGLGEVAFTGIELGQPPLAAWSGRDAFLHALFHPYLADEVASDAPQRLVTNGYADLSGALRQQLGRSFPFVVPIGFPMVTGLVIAYMLFLGPLDYLLVHRLLRRPLLAWITFPLIVAVFSILAVAAGNWSKGTASPRVNRLQVVDFDTISGESRGTFWAALYSPDANQFDLAVKVPELDKNVANKTQMLFSWWGLPGVGIGGMQTGGDLGIVRSGYRYGRDGTLLEQVPVLASATKSLLARWAGTYQLKIDAQLTDEDGLVIGSITNQTGSALRNVRLLYGSWAYRLGTLNAGEHVEVGEQLSPRRAKTIVTRDALGESGATAAQVEGRVFAAEQASAKDILNLMMFYETAGGFGFAHLPNRYQAYCDLSRQLELGRAVLIADAAGPGAQLVDNSTGETIGDDKLDSSAVVYRFVLPVKRSVVP